MSNNLFAYEAKIVGVEKVEKTKKDGDTYEVVEVKYNSNGKDFTTNVLYSNKDLVKLLKGIKGKEKTLVFEKKGKFLSLVNILEKGESKKYAKSSGSNYKKTQTFNSEGMERGNALHCASRLVAALLHQGKLDHSDPSKLAQLVNDLADSIQKGRTSDKKEEKKADVDEFEEVETDKETGADEFSDDSESEVHEDFNDEIQF